MHFPHFSKSFVSDMQRSHRRPLIASIEYVVQQLSEDDFGKIFAK